MSIVVAMVRGGIKGAVAAATYAGDHELVFVHFKHGQPAVHRQATALKKLCQAYPGARLVSVDGSTTVEVDPAQPRAPGGGLSADVKVADRLARPGDMRGIIPSVLSAGFRIAVRLGAAHVVTGISQTMDEAQQASVPGEGMPDHRREFLHAFDIMAQTSVSSKVNVSIQAPLMDLTYAEMLRLAVRLQVPLEATWTCELGDSAPCGRCGHCLARQSAFTEAGVTDPGQPGSGRRTVRRA